MSHAVSYVALVSSIILLQYIYFVVRAGSARGKDTVVAPATTGDHTFECRLRIQLNTLEQMVVVIPAMWLCTHFFRADVAAISGVTFIVARAIYASGYPNKRAPGMVLTLLANVVLIGCTLYGVIVSLI